MAKRVLFPTYEQAAGPELPFSRYLLSFPMSLVKYGGVWHAVVSPAHDLLLVAENYYLGGYQRILTDAEAADLPPQYVEIF